MVDILYFLAFSWMKFFMNRLKKYGSLIYDFFSEPVLVEVITLPVKASTYSQWVTIQINFLVVKLRALYNAIIERPGLCAFDAVVSVKYLVKFSTSHGVGQIKGNQAVA